MKCADHFANWGNMFGHGGSRVRPCSNEATHAIKMHPKDANTIDGWRPVCWIHGNSYPGWKIVPIAETKLLEDA